MQDYERLSSLIDDHERDGRTRLPSEPHLCEVLSLNRGRLRTLLRRAEEDGRIWRHVGKGTFVGPRSAVSAPLSEADDVSLSDILDARLLLEPQLAGEAALHATAAEVAAMRRCIADMAVAEDFLQWKRLDARLHHLIAEATHNRLLVRLYDMLRPPPRSGLQQRLEQVYGGISGPRANTHGEHVAVVDAIAVHDRALAEAVTRDHILSVRANLFGLR